MNNPLKDFLQALECAEDASDVDRWLMDFSKVELKGLLACLVQVKSQVEEINVK